MKYNFNKQVDSYVMKHLTKEEVHNFIEEFTTRYKDYLNENRDMRNVFERELNCLIANSKCFKIGEKYSNNDRSKSITIENQIEEHSLIVKDNYGEYYECFILYDEVGEYIKLHDTIYYSY